MKFSMRWVAALLAVVLIAGACSSRDDETGTEESPSPTAAAQEESAVQPDAEADTEAEPEAEAEAEPAVDAEPEVVLEATEIGVTATEIRIGVIADIDTPVAPGLSQSIHDAAEAWADSVNANGGVAGRQIVLTKYDSKLNPDESVNAVIEACQNEFALVGSGMFAFLNPAPLIECADINGDITGLPDLASLSVSPGQGASTTTFPAFVNGQVFYAEEPTFVLTHAGIDYAASLLGDVTPKALVIETGTPGIRTAAVAISNGLVADRGFETAGVVAFPTTATQAEALPIINTIREQGVNLVYALPISMAKLMAEARVQGLDMDSIAWLCTGQCFSPFYASAFGEASDGLIVGVNTLPWTDADHPVVAEYLASVDREQVSSNGVVTTAAGKGFEELMTSLVDAHGPNGITRANLLALLRTGPVTTAGGLLGPGSVLGRNSECYVVVQLIDGAYQRVDPAGTGEFICDPSSLSTVVNPTE